MPQFEQALVSVDVVAFVYRDGALGVLLPPRRFDPFLGEAALPGVLVGRESSVQAAGRALEVKAGADAAALHDVGVFDTDGRDPRGPTMAIAKLALGVRGRRDGEVVAPEHLVDLGAAEGLPFDHDAIIGRAVEVLGRLLVTDPDSVRHLFGPSLTVRDMLAVGRVIEQRAGRAIVPVNNNGVRRLLDSHGAVKTGEYQAGSTKGSPSALYEI